jgi:pyruvate dehydrogenase E2 component (dihydrolipoamide acetyltransferase)
VAREFRMPSLGADMDAGKLVEWLKRPGDAVRRGEVVAVVETQKGAIEIEIFQDGVLDQLLVQPGETVPVDTVLATLRGDGEAPAAEPVPLREEPEAAKPAPAAEVAAPPPPPAPKPAPASAAASPPPQPAAPPPPAAAAAPIATPGARRLAAQHGIDLTGIVGSGPGGAVLRADVERAVAAPPPPAEAEPAPQAIAAKPAATDAKAAIRQAIAAAMARSKREIPHYYLRSTIDMLRAMGWLEAENARLPVESRLLPAVLLMKAVALALGKVPALNGFLRDGHFEAAPAAHVGWAVSLRGGGLIAPGLHDVQAKDLATLMAELRDLVARARSGGLRSSELADPTITVTSLGDQGVDEVLGVIFPPQVAIVGFGSIAPRPLVVDGAVVARPSVVATLSADHRVTDGHQGALFLQALGRQLQEPDQL